MGLDINKIASQMHCSANEAVQRLKEDALLRAQYGVTEQQLNELLNGGSNWGRMMDEYAFNPERAQEYKDNLPNAEKERQLAEARKRHQKKEELREREEFKQNNRNKVAHVAGEVIKGLLAFTPLGWTACSDINSEQNQQVYLDLGTLFSSIQARLDDILNEIKGLRGDMSVQYSNLLAKIDTAIHQNYTTQQELMLQVRNIANDFMTLLNQIIKNQGDIRSDNNRNAEDIKKLLEQILNSQEDADVKLQKIYDLIDEAKGIIVKIDGNVNDINNKIDTIIKNLEASLDNDKTIIAALEKLDKNDQKTQSILTAIYNAINGLGAEFKAYFKDIIVQLANGNKKLGDIEKILNTINKNIESIKSLVTKYGDEGSKLGNAILNAIKNLNFNTTVDLSGIEALLKQISGNQVDIKGSIGDLTNNFNKFSASTTAQLNTIIAKLDKTSPDYSKQLNTIIDMLAKLDANNEARNNKLLCAIEKLGNKLSADIAVIIAKLDKTSPDYNAKLDAIIALLEKLDANNEERNKKVIDAINKLGVNISADLTKILNKIGQGGQDGKDYSSVLNAILAKLGDIDANNTKNFNRVIEALGKLSVGDKTDVDLKPILDKLEEILKAIKDHKVTVDVTGKVCCECNCGNNTVHEGVLGNLNDLLG